MLPCNYVSFSREQKNSPPILRFVKSATLKGTICTRLKEHGSRLDLKRLAKLSSKGLLYQMRLSRTNKPRLSSPSTAPEKRQVFLFHRFTSIATVPVPPPISSSPIPGLVTPAPQDASSDTPPASPTCLSLAWRSTPPSPADLARSTHSPHRAGTSRRARHRSAAEGNS